MSLHAGLRVRHWRELKGVSQLDLAERVKMDPARLCRIENGRTRARADEIERLAKELDLSMPEFYGEAKAS